jgi:hypothetical protein
MPQGMGWDWPSVRCATSADTGSHGDRWDHGGFALPVILTEKRKFYKRRISVNLPPTTSEPNGTINATMYPNWRSLSPSVATWRSVEADRRPAEVHGRRRSRSPPRSSGP